MTIETARMIEVFSSIQGEGPLVGVRQIFVRFFGCNIRCLYCDTRDVIVKPETCLVETSPGSRVFDKVTNPVSPNDFMDIMQRFVHVPHHSISLTGGEPLLHATFLKLVLPSLHKLGPKIFLETNGILSQQLESVLEWIDIISMDIKLSSTLEPAHDFFDEHEDFLRLAIGKELFVKLVVTADTQESEVVRAVELVKSVHRSVPIVLQPVTPAGEIENAPTSEQLLHLHSVASRIQDDIRIIPQVHKLIGML